MTHPTMQRFAEPQPRHGDLTGQVRARLLREKAANDEAAERERQAAEVAEQERAAADDPDLVIDLSTAEQRAAFSGREWDDRDGSLG